MGDSKEPVTQVLEEVSAGEEHAAEKLLSLAYDELRKLAAQKMANEAPVRPCNPPCWSTKPGCGWSEWRTGGFQIRAHFVAAAAEAMRRMIRRGTPHKTDLLRPAGAPGRRSGHPNHGTPTLGQG